MFEYIVLGVVQGLAEWIPISSEGAIFFTMVHFFDEVSLVDILRIALFLHLGTFFAALIYFWKDVTALIRALFSYWSASRAIQAELRFLIISTVVSSIIGGVLFLFLSFLEGSGIVEQTTFITTIVVGVLLIITGIIQLVAKEAPVQREREDLTWWDGVILGIGQGLSALPGVSRSGTTVSLLLLLNIQKDQALRLSFIMSLPIVVAGNIALNLDYMTRLNSSLLLACLAAFITGLATIHLLLVAARKINFAYFALAFGVLVIFAGLLAW